MKKSMIIATCLANAGMDRNAVDCLPRVQIAFAKSYPSHDFAQWDAEVEDDVADWLIASSGSIGHLQTDRLIADLWEPPFALNSGRMVAP